MNKKIKTMKLNFIKKIQILSFDLSVKWDKTHDGGSFDLENSEITIGIKNYHKDPSYTFSIISHEIMEMILACMNARYSSSRMDNNYLFNFGHQTFENAIQIHAGAISKFINQK